MSTSVRQRTTSTQSPAPFPPPSSSAPLPVPSSILPSTPLNQPNGSLPNTPLAISFISAVLATLVVVPLTYVVQPYLVSLGSAGWGWARPQLGAYLASVGVFHLLEFWVTAGWNPAKLSVDSFLINNGAGYHAAHVAGLVEYFLSSYFFPGKYTGILSSPLYLVPVFAILILAQTFRSLAMIHANHSFSHVVKAVKHDDHVLITNGVYAWVRHPSYVGFFWWAIATQLLLGNIASTLAFVYVLGRFFYYRIINEERHLVRFFGKDYVEYRKRVGTGLPFPIPTNQE
ncbi:protein-S-isoprenylcysteine O-methyltransferase [Dioszegia hungarica]|uniref:Protein-S-isoprenylcysteine O-methyltransferase n=1 Tax=Dioszegia hungarica TaxID=4972 RepID=A0AA38LR44_9TREE|nr:protein-S-isoprenylcysteine O-methyltransferase [Dioszegia hungarica]KAI9632565.1 protein-S-isoprenylcysteine O-methyltransferase [Dioszegia hungarica]